MAESSEPNLFQQLTTKIEKVINDHPVTAYEAIESKVYAPHRFLDKFAKKELILMHRFSANRIIGALKLIFNTTDGILKKKTSGLPFPVINRLCIYYTLAASCINSRPISPGEEVADEMLGRQIISQSTIIFGNDFDIYTTFVQKTFKSFLSAIGSHSSLIYTYFLNAYQSDIVAGASLKVIQISLKPWKYMPASIDHVINFLKPIASNVNLITDKYREPFCQMMASTLLAAFQRDPVAFSDFLTLRSDIMLAASIQGQISSWNTSNNPFAWPAIAALSILLPNSQLSSGETIPRLDFIQRYKDFYAQKESKLSNATIQSILVYFHAFAVSSAHKIILRFLHLQFPNFVKNNFTSLPDQPGDFAKVQKIFFPIAILFNNPQFFTKDVIQYITQHDNNHSLTMALIIKRFCKTANPFPDFSKGFIQSLIPQTLEIIRKPIPDPKSTSLLPHIITGFQAYPFFMRTAIFSDPDICEILFSYVAKYPEVNQQFSYVAFFNTEFTQESVLDEVTLLIYKRFISFLLKRYTTLGMYKPAYFDMHIPEIIHAISESLLQIFQQEANITEQLAKLLLPLLQELETFALMFFASSKRNIISIGISMMYTLVEIVHVAPDLLSSKMPVDDYQRLVSDARDKKDPKKIPIGVCNILKTVPNPTPGINLVYNALFSYFMAICKKLDANITLVQPPELELDTTGFDLDAEFISVISMIFSIVFDQTIHLFNQMKVFLQNDSDIGQIATSAIPTCLAPRHYNPLMTILLGYFRQFSNNDGTFNMNQKNIIFLNNILNLIRGVCSQIIYWTPEMINQGIFGQLGKKIVSLCDVTQGESTKLICLRTLLAMVRLANEKGKPFEPKMGHSISKTILTWLPQSNEGTRDFINLIHEALALILDELSLIECVDIADPKGAAQEAEKQFLFYFASIKNRLEKEPNSAKQIIPVLAALLKQNLSIAIGHCLSMGFDNTDSVRTAFLASVAAVFKVPEIRVVGTAEAVTEEVTLVDILFSGSLKLIEIIGNNIEYSRAEHFAKAALEAALLSGRAYEYFARMVDVELQPIDDSNKNTIFRGNQVPARAVGHWPRFVAMDWLKQTLRPIFDEVIASCENNVGFIVNPAKLPEGQTIEVNTENFRQLLQKTVQAILDGQTTMPDSLTYASQIIFEKVFEKVGEFAYSILSSFLFLRFIIPSFSNVSMVGITSPVGDQPRDVLMQTSNVIMSSILKGRLDDKYTYLAPYNDLAKWTQDSINQMFRGLVQKQVSHEPPPITIDAAQTIANIHSEVYPILKNLTPLIESLDPASDDHANAKRFITKIRAMGQPSNAAKKMFKSDEAGASGYEELMNMTFPPDQVQQLEEAIYKDEKTAPDGNGVIYIHFNKLSSVRDPRIVAQLLFKALRKDESQQCYVCLCLTGFDPSRIPNQTMLQTYAIMPPSTQNIKQYLIIEPPNEFAVFVKENQQLFTKPQRFEVIDSVAKLTRILGNTPTSIPPSTYESFSEAQAVYSVVLNGDPTKIRLHEHSLQIIGDNVEIAGHPFTPVRVIMADQIKDFEKSLGSKQHMDEFNLTITMKSGIVYSMRVPVSSPMYDAAYQLTLRSRTINNAIQSVNVNSSTLQWMMLNLAFINIIGPESSLSLKKAALDLIYAVFVSFQFSHNVSVDKIQYDILPNNLSKYVREISTDLASCNAENVNDFMSEFFNAAKYVKSKVLPTIFYFLVPWIKCFANQSDPPKNLISEFIEMYNNMKGSDQVCYPEYVWPSLCQNDFIIETLVDIIFERNESTFVEIPAQLAAIKPSFVSQSVCRKFTEILDNNDKDHIDFLRGVLTSMISLHMFDFESTGAVLIYNCTKSRLIFDTSILQKMSPILMNIIHELFRQSGSGIQFDFDFIIQSFVNTDGSEDFKTLKDTYKWTSSARCVAEIISAAINNLQNSSIKRKLFDMFSNDIKKRDTPLLCAQGIIYSAAFAVDPSSYANDLVQKLRDCEEILVTPIILGLSLINMTIELSAKLYFIGIALGARDNNAACGDLVVSALKQYSDHQGTTQGITQYINSSLVEYLETCTALPLQQQPSLSAAAILACYAKYGLTQALEKLATTKSDEQIISAFRVIKEPSKSEEISRLDYGANLVNLSAILLVFLKVGAPQVLIEFAINLFTEQPNGLGCFDAIGNKFGKQIFEVVNDARFTGLLLRNSRIKNEEYQLTSILNSLFFEMDNVIISKEQADHLVYNVFI
ncbi:negative regulation of centriole-centriole cohesion [Trichomonas vaginalis G3]|nr:negative regulation of centriole-centriole cohesion [Trichomonas vaginalis G3]KAI5516460.1 negative regulation of centriole-centriole cohesion [Trichomonas vaginalis G3]